MPTIWGFKPIFQPVDRPILIYMIAIL